VGLADENGFHIQQQKDGRIMIWSDDGENFMESGNIDILLAWLDD
jgi:hypothetical protein